MSRFEALLSVEKVQVRPKAIWKLNRDLVYHSDMAGMIVVPAGYNTDFASVPRMPFAYLAVGGKADEASVIHDFLYTTQMLGGELIERGFADMVFEEAVKALGYSAVTSSLLYTGVSIGGLWTWNAENVVQEPRIAKQLNMQVEAP